MFITYLDESGCTGAMPSATSQIQPIFSLLAEKLDSVLLDVEWTRQQIKEKYLGDVLPNLPRLPRRNLLWLFQNDRDGNKKGIIAIDLRELP